MTLKSQIIKLLEELPKTRENDKYLTAIIWLKFYNEKIFKDQNGEPCVKLKDIMNLPSQDVIKRHRAKLNEQGLYLPNNPEVIKARRQKQDEWQKELNYNYKPNL